MSDNSCFLHSHKAHRRAHLHKIFQNTKPKIDIKVAYPKSQKTHSITIVPQRLKYLNITNLRKWAPPHPQHTPNPHSRQKSSCSLHSSLKNSNFFGNFLTTPSFRPPLFLLAIGCCDPTHFHQASIPTTSRHGTYLASFNYSGFNFF